MNLPQKNMRSDGFVLAATVWLLAFIAVAAAFFSAWTQQAVSTAQKAAASIDEEVDWSNTQATVLYTALTRGMNNLGLSKRLPLSANDEDPFVLPDSSSQSWVYVDDTAYEGFGRCRFSVQDEGGLVALNYAHSEHLPALLGLLGVPVAERKALISRLFDYTDRDELKRLNGAEAAAYQAVGLTPPPNRRLFSQYEARNILGWAEHEGLWRNGGLAAYTNVLWDALPNFNTAPPQVLQTWTGIGVEQARMLVEARRRKPFSSLAEIESVIGHSLNIDPLNLAFFPTRYHRITLWSEGGRRMREIHVELNPNREGGKPWTVHYVIDGTIDEARQGVAPLDAGLRASGI